MARTYGYIRKRPDRRDYLFRAPRPYTGAFVDLSDRFPQGPYDQGALGSCVANGGAGCVDFALAKAGGTILGPGSRLFLYYQGRVRGGYPLNQDTGLQIRDVFDVMGKDGAPPERLWPYVIERFAEKPPPAAYAEAGHHIATTYGAVAYDDLWNTIASGYPVAFGFDVYESFEFWSTSEYGVVPVPDKGTETYLGGHCMVVCSTPKDGSEIPFAIPGVKYAKVRNSWGTGWGLGGYAWFPVAEFDNNDAGDFWMVTTINDPNVPKPPPPPAPWPCHWIGARAANARAHR